MEYYYAYSSSSLYKHCLDSLTDGTLALRWSRGCKGIASQSCAQFSHSTAEVARKISGKRRIARVLRVRAEMRAERAASSIGTSRSYGLQRVPDSTLSSVMLSVYSNIYIREKSTSRHMYFPYVCLSDPDQ